MGYSIAAPIKNAELHAKMLSFLKNNFRSWPELTGQEHTYISEPTDDLSYDHGHNRIGFDYNAFGGERHYAFSIVRWIAIKVGRRTPFTKTPFYVYDGYEVMAILVDGSKSHPKGSLTDKFGVPRQTLDAHLVHGIWCVQFELNTLDESDALNIIRKEIQRLDHLWNKL